MSKKLTKTIILIVFVVFLGIDKADAKTAKTCVYAKGDETITITINDTFSSANKAAGSFHGDIINWDSNHKSGFSGYDYFDANGRTCPPKLLIARYTTTNDAYFTDESSLSAVKSYAKKQANLGYWGEYIYDLKSETDGEGLHGDTSNNNSVNKVTAKTCSCSGTDKEKKISVTIKVNDNLSNPRTTIKFADSTNDESIENWESSYGNSTYTYKNDLASNNRCPAYAVVSRSPNFNSYLLLVSDSSNISSIQTEAKKFGNNWFGASPATVYTVGCKETLDNDTPNTSNKPTEPPAEYDDPTVNSNVTPLNPTLTTYSCGDGYLTGIPEKFPKLTKFIYVFLQVLVPIAIIILGSLDLLKAVAAQKEDEIKKGQQVFIKRLIGAAIVFFVFAIVKFIISIVSSNSTSIINCMDCFLKYNDSCVRE